SILARGPSMVSESPRRRRERDRTDGGAGDFGVGAGDLDGAQRLPTADEVACPRRKHVAGLAERHGEAAVVEVAEIVDPAVGGAEPGVERPLAAIGGMGAVERLRAAV